FSELIAPHLGRRVLEIGAGIGTYSSRIAAEASVERLTCVEVEPRLVDAARKALAAAQIQTPVDHVVGDYFAATLPKDHFDSALLINVLEHLRDDRAAVRKARSELRMDGRLVI